MPIEIMPHEPMTQFMSKGKPAPLVVMLSVQTDQASVAQEKT